ncbi:MAG TPA: hypothetical protein VLH56_19465 [Dissulfurispiraceae bacterium]|nr:hypothetical protein [Dissulfurispiraceae bacterium]
MNWHDRITIGEQQVELVPQARVLVERNGKWIVAFDAAPGLVCIGGIETGPSVAAACTPILPAVTPGCGYTREQALEACFGNDVLIDLGGGYWAQCDAGRWYLVYDQVACWDATEIPALKLAIQRFEALLAWWANGGER